MADVVLGTIAITITGDTAKLDAALKSAVANARAAGANISAALATGSAGADKIVIAIGRLAGVIQQEGAAAALAMQRLSATIENESAAASLAAQRNMAMAQSMGGAASAARNLGSSAHSGGFGIRYLVLGAKDLAEGRMTMVMAEMVSIISRMGPAVLTAAGALAVLGGTVYLFTELGNKIQDAKDKSVESFGAIVRGLRLANDELDVSNEKLKNQIALIEGKPVNRSAEALYELRVEADKATDALRGTLDALHKALAENGIGAFKGLFTNQASTGKIGDLEKNFARQSAEIERKRQAALNAPGITAEGAKGVNDSFDKQLSDKVKYFTEAARQVVAGVAQVEAAAQSSLGSTPANMDTLRQQAEDFVASLELAQQRRAKSEEELANRQKLQGDQDAKRGAEQARSLAVAQIEARIKAADEQVAAAKQQVEIEEKLIRQSAQIQIDGLSSEAGRADAAAQADIAMAENRAARLGAIDKAALAQKLSYLDQLAAAEKIGQTPAQRGLVDVRTGQEKTAATATAATGARTLSADISEAQGKLLATQATFAREFADGALKAFRDVGDGYRKLTDLLESEGKKAAEVQGRVFQVEDQSAGETKALELERKKLQLQQQYGLEGAHSRQEQVDFAKQEAEIDALARQQKIDAKTQELADQPQGKDRDIVKEAQLEAELVKLRAEAANANLAANTKILETEQKLNDALQARISLLSALKNWREIGIGTVERQLAESLVSIPQKLGNSLADSIFNAPKRGQSKGAEIGQGLVKTGESIGKDITGKLITSAIEKLVAQLLGQAAIASLQSSVMAANTAATTALTAATVAATATQVPAMAALTGAILALIPALYVDAGASLFGFATGGPVPHDMIAQVHGGEYVLNKDQVSGRSPLPPQFQTGGLTALGNMPLPSRMSLPGMSNSSSSASVTIGQMHVHGVQNARQLAEGMVREIPRVLKARGPQWSPYSS